MLQWGDVLSVIVVAAVLSYGQRYPACALRRFRRQRLLIMSEASVLAAEALTKIYSDGRHNITVLNQLQLEIASGEWLAVVGASGAGKSTLLNCLGGLDLPTSGVVRVAGRALPSLSESERSQWRNQHLGFVFQMHHLLPEFSAGGRCDAGRIGGLVGRLPLRAQKLLEQLGLGDRLQHRPAALSGGERRSGDCASAG